MAEAFDIHRLSGLSEAQAAQRLKEDGYNELPTSRRRSVFAIALEVVREPMFLLLVACGAIYLGMGREHLGDALMLLGFVFVVMGITIVQERRTERALEALRDLSSPRVLVIRDGARHRIAGREVVRGDLVILTEGDRVPADARVMHGISLSVDESLLTGESAPVRKAAGGGDEAIGRPGGDDLPFVFSGTLVTQGQGIAEVLATGLETEIGKIGKALRTLTPQKTRLQRETGRLVRNLAVVGLSLCAVVVVIYGLTRGNTWAAWEQGLLAGIAMAMATLPEEFPVVLTIFLALGAWRISRNRVLTRRTAAIETLGAATVLCVDKTGTLTMNAMTISRLYAGGEFFDAQDPAAKTLPEQFHQLLEFGILASKRDPFDPMDKAFKALGERCLVRTEHLHDNWTLVHEYPLSPALLALSHVWKSPDGTDFVIAAKGAPEAVADLCHLDAARMDELSRHIAVLADQGLRVLGVAKGRFRQAPLPDGQHDFEFSLVGLVGMADPVRPMVPEAIQECYRAGIRVIMITGDYPGTAQKIGREIGLRDADRILTGPELDRMSDSGLAERIRDANVFARVVPEQKLRIVRALAANREIVAMTGDGVNDAPALKAAHIGIAMGGRGTDVARESSDLVLLDDDFSSIVQAVRLGRRIFDNIKKAIAYIFAVHVPIAGLSFIPVLFSDWPLILLPVHIVFLELIIDPACSVVFEAEEAEADIMRRPPRDSRERLFGFHAIGVSLLQGVSVLAVVLGIFLVSRFYGESQDMARALAFTTLVVANLGLILTNRSWSRTIPSTMKMSNKALWWVLGGATAFMAAALYVPLLRGLFHFTALNAENLALCLAAGAASVLWFEGVKVFKTWRAAKAAA
ncbi:MAG: cation-translocating P-type ATPase [Planctomycetes bacterium]|nr:cation-translocating P-type ATPase [Planctomycetota bacterium]